MSRYLYILILLVLPWFARAQVKPTRSQNVQVIDTAFKMPQLNKQRRIWIYLPQGYADQLKNTLCFTCMTGKMYLMQRPPLMGSGM